MSVYKSPKSPYWQYDFIYQGNRFHGSTGQTTKSKAEAVERKKRELAATGQSDKRRIPTLDEAAAGWWLAKGQNLRSAEDVERRLALAVVLVGKGRLVNQIGSADIEAAINRRRGMLVHGKKPPSNATINRDIVDTLRPVLRRARAILNDGSGPPVPFPEITWKELELAEPKPLPRDFTPAEVDGMVEALPVHWRDLARFLSRYGLRLGEAFFPLSAVQIDARRLYLTDRKNGDHVVPLLADDAAMLAARVGRARAAGIDTVWFRELKSGKLKALRYWGAQHALGDVMRAVGLDKKGGKGAHSLRHHSGMQMLRATGNLRVTQKLLGHKSIQSTLVYAHALDNDVLEGLEAVSRNSPGEAKPEAGKGEEKQSRKG